MPGAKFKSDSTGDFRLTLRRKIRCFRVAVALTADSDGSREAAIEISVKTFVQGKIGFRSPVIIKIGETITPSDIQILVLAPTQAPIHPVGRDAAFHRSRLPEKCVPFDRKVCRPVVGQRVTCFKPAVTVTPGFNFRCPVDSHVSQARARIAGGYAGNGIAPQVTVASESSPMIIAKRFAVSLQVEFTRPVPCDRVLIVAKGCIANNVMAVAQFQTAP